MLPKADELDPKTLLYLKSIESALWKIAEELEKLVIDGR